MADDVRSGLDALIRESGEDYSSVSRLLGRNSAYIQQFIKRGTPRRLSEEDRRKLAAFFRVPEQRLGGPVSATAVAPLIAVSRVEIGASAGPGTMAEIEERGAPIGFDPSLLRALGVRPGSSLSIIRVTGDSMEPTLLDGDDILVDLSEASVRYGAVHVLRFNEMLMVKRLLREGQHRLIVKSDNPAYPAMHVDDPSALRVIGRVLWCGRRLA